MFGFEDLIDSGDIVALIDMAESGNALACLTLGRMYYSGTGVPVDTARAEALYGVAASNGSADVIRTLGAMYLNGDCARRDDYTAAELFHRAAVMDDPLSQFYIGQMYREGIGVLPSESKAEMWLSRAARNGIRRAAHV